MKRLINLLILGILSATGLAAPFGSARRPVLQVSPSPSTPNLSNSPHFPLVERNSCPRNPILYSTNGQSSGAFSLAPTSLVQISASTPYTPVCDPYGDYTIATITPGDVCTIFTIAIPAAATANKSCSLIFNYPTAAQTPYLGRVSGPGHFQFQGYKVGCGGVPGVTTYARQPPEGVSPPSPPPVMLPGKSYVVMSGSCEMAGIDPDAGGSVLVSGAMCSGDSELKLRQSSDAKWCPIGFFVLVT